MADENKEAKKDGELTPGQTAPTDDKKGNQKPNDQLADDEEKVTLSKKELEDLKKRAEDFDRSVELKRLAKLGKKEIETPKSDDEIVAKVQKLEEELSSFKAQSFNSNLSEAYRSFVSDNPWANDDAKFDKIKENFNSVGTETKEELFAKLKSAAISAFPTEYSQHLEEKIKAKALSSKIDDAGGSGAPGSIIHKDENKKTEEDKMKEKMATLYAKNQPSKR